MPYGTYRYGTSPDQQMGTYDYDTSFPNANYTFTDQEDDDETGLYNYKARLYDPQIGRFISADTIVPNPGDLQAFNRYSYCMNNPLVYTDPSGHEVEGGGGPDAGTDGGGFAGPCDWGGPDVGWTASGGASPDVRGPDYVVETETWYFTDDRRCPPVSTTPCNLAEMGNRVREMTDPTPVTQQNNENTNTNFGPFKDGYKFATDDNDGGKKSGWLTVLGDPNVQLDIVGLIALGLGGKVGQTLSGVASGLGLLKTIGDYETGNARGKDVVVSGGSFLVGTFGGPGLAIGAGLFQTWWDVDNVLDNAKGK
jgi:RHS repeat-associated protein